MELKTPLRIALLVAMSSGGCGADTQTAATGGFGGDGIGAVGGVGASGGIGGGAGNIEIGNPGGNGGNRGVSYEVCTLGLCMEDAELGASCLHVYDGCVGRGHYEWACRMDADETCGVFGQTGPYY